MYHGNVAKRSMIIIGRVANLSRARQCGKRCRSGCRPSGASSATPTRSSWSGSAGAARALFGVRAAADHRRDRVKCGGGAGAVGTSGLREIRTPAATLAAKRFGAGTDEIYGVVNLGEIVGDADDEASLALLGHADDGDDARAELPLGIVHQAA